MYGFQVDFQRDIWKNDSFQIIYEEFINENKKTVDTGEIIFASLNLKIQIFNFTNMNMKKIKLIILMKMEKASERLMKAPINGARLSSSYGKRKHPILVVRCILGQTSLTNWYTYYGVW